MKAVLRSLIPVWILLGLVVGYFAIMISMVVIQETWSHHQWSPQFPATYQEMEAKAKWVREFKTAHGAFPNREEVTAKFPPSGFYLQTDAASWDPSWGEVGEAFIVHETVGEWNLSLRSWDGGRMEVYNE